VGREVPENEEAFALKFAGNSSSAADAILPVYLRTIPKNRSIKHIKPSFN
jgi:hypothetical protein